MPTVFSFFKAKERQLRGNSLVSINEEVSEDSMTMDCCFMSCMLLPADDIVTH